MHVNFRYSDTDFIAYLMTLNYQYKDIEIIRDRNKQLKAYVHFEGNKDELIKIQNEYKNGLANANILYFSNNRKKITKILKSEILKYQANNI
jgi:glutaredoxin-related protein